LKSPENLVRTGAQLRQQRELMTIPWI